MPRITLIALLLLSVPAMAKENCGGRIQAFNEYEEMQNGKIIEKVSLFDLPNWSPNEGFQGLAVRATEKPGTKLEVEMQKAKKKQKASAALSAWAVRKDFQYAEKFNPKEFFSEKFSGGTFVVRLIVDGKVACESGPHKISSGD